MLTLTDPALEIAELHGWLTRLPRREETTHARLADALQLDVESPEYSHVMASAKRRLLRLANVAAHAIDDRLEQDQRDAVVAACNRMTLIFSPARQHMPWSTAVAHSLVDADATALKFFSYAARAYYPLRRLGEDERRAIRERLVLNITELTEVGPEVPWVAKDARWVVAPLIDGLRLLLLMIDRFHFFGHDQVVEHLLTLGATAKALADEPAVQGDGAMIGAVRNVLGFIVAAAAAFTVPADLHGAYVTYADWGAKAVELLKPLLQLPPPA